MDILRSITKIFTSSPVLIFAEKVNLNLTGPMLDNMSSTPLPIFNEYIYRAKLSMRDPKLFDLLGRMFIVDPSARITAAEALEHSVFDEIKAELKEKEKKRKKK